MTLRSWILLSVLFAMAVSEKLYPVRVLCETLVGYYRNLYPLADVAVDLEYMGGSKRVHLYGKGPTVFSPNIYINHCESIYLRNETRTIINISVTTTLTVRFQDRPWVVFEDCEIEMLLVSQPTFLEDEMSIFITSIQAHRIRKVSANCGVYEVDPDEVKPVLNAALKKFSDDLVLYYVKMDDHKYAERQKLFFERQFQHYMSRLVV